MHEHSLTCRDPDPAVLLVCDHPHLALGRTTPGLWSAVDAGHVLHIQHSSGITSLFQKSKT